MIYQNIKQLLADWRAEDSNDYFVRDVKGYKFIDTGGHGYLVLGSEDNGYSQALAIARSSNYSPIINTLVFLEEDCDATEFLNKGLTNYAEVTR